LPQAGSTALGICAVDFNTKKWSYELVLEPREAIYLASISPDISRSVAKLRYRGEIAISSPFAQEYLDV
jgi:hypothetical protein